MDRVQRRDSEDRVALPDFMIIGAHRAGTTSLYDYLSQHPDVVGAARKEVHYFDVNYDRGRSWYEAQFFTAAQPDQHVRQRGQVPVTGEASPYYMMHPLVPARVRETVPGVRLIVVLRDPVARAYSHYRYELAHGFETLSFAQALSREPERLQGEEDRLLRDPAYISFAHVHHSYAARGLYLKQLERWLEVFSRSDLFVVEAEDLFCRHGSVCDELLAFIGLRPWRSPRYPWRNRQEHDPLHPDIKQELGRFFAKHNESLYDFLGRDLQWERNGG